MEKKKVSNLRALSEPVCVKIDDSIEMILSTALRHSHAHDFCVVDKDKALLGVINIKRIFRTIFFHHTSRHTMIRRLIDLTSAQNAGDIMLADPMTVRESETLDEVILKMIKHDLGELPVVDDEGRLLGVLTVHRILQEWMHTKCVSR